MSNLQTLLIVDDEPEIAELFESLVEDEFATTVSTDPAAARDLIQSQQPPFDLVVTDLKMPGVSGTDIIVAAKERCVTTKVFVSSGHAAEDDLVQEALRLGADGLIAKPYTDLDLVLSTLQS